jgi:anti-sigma factor RsiW
VSLVVDFEESRHRHVERELPWYVNGSLEAAGRERIEAHLAQCSRCRREAAGLRHWQQEIARPLAAEVPAAPDFEALRRRLAATSAASATPAAGAPPGWRELPAWLRWTALAQASVLALVVISLLRIDGGAGNYRVLGAPAAAARAQVPGPRALLMFTPGLTQAEVRRLLRANGARIVDGPNPAGAWLVALPPDRAPQALAALRAARGVVLVESMDAGQLR